MILWTIKLIGSVRRAIAGRKNPHQLAWAVAFGLLLGIVPHGNLLAIAMLLVVLSLKINHAMAGLTALGATFLATRLDPYSHQVGQYVLTHPQLSDKAANAWQLPLVPWTDLNNTVVMGSFLIGVGALVPVFAITYPMFRLLAPKDEDPSDGEEQHHTSERQVDESAHEIVLVDRRHDQVSPPHQAPSRTTPVAAASVPVETSAEAGATVSEGESGSSDQIAVETRIDVIRMKDHRGPIPSGGDDDSSPQQPMDEALNYLLRQLRDSQQRKAA